MSTQNEAGNWVYDYSDGFVGNVHDKVRFSPNTGKEYAVQTVYLDIKALKDFIDKSADGATTISVDLQVSKKGGKYAKISAFGGK